MALMHIDNIRVNTRLREINPDRVRELIESIRHLGLLNPITLHDDGTLVAGYHRLEACRRLAEEDEAFAIVPISYFDHEDKTLQAEIAENLFRHELSILERAEHLVLYLEQWDTALPAQEQAEILGMSRKTLFNYRRIVRDICLEHRQELKKRHPELCASTRQLLDFAQRSKAEQKAWLFPGSKSPKAKKEKIAPGLKTLSTPLPERLHQELKQTAQQNGLSQKELTQQLLQAGLKAVADGRLKLKGK